MNTLPTPYPALNTVLHEMVSSIQAILGADFVGAYLQGSFAVGDFDQHSDVDFIVAARQELSAGQVEALQAMHPRIHDLPIPWAQHLEGSYFPVDVLRDAARAGEPLWYLDHGSRSLIQDKHCNTLVVRWTLRKHGVTLAGPPLETLVDPIPVEALRREILADIHDWGREILDNADHFNNRFYQGFIVLSYCRMLHDLIAGDVSSKRTSAAWAKATLDPAWHGLIDRTWACRPDPATSVRTRPDPADFQATLRFIEVIIEASDRYAAAHHL